MSKYNIDTTNLPQDILDLPAEMFEVAKSDENMMDENYQLWVKTYEEFYKTPLTFNK